MQPAADRGRQLDPHRRPSRAGAPPSSPGARPGLSKPVHIGCSGWNYRDWRGVIYPDDVPARAWLGRYSELFKTVEVNATFYRLPTEKTVQTWAKETPGDFRFAVKASRYMTHVYRLKEPKRGGTRLFFERLEPLRAAGKLGPILWQLPQNFKRDDERLAGVLGRAPAGRHAFEFRHESWFTRDVYDILAAHCAALVISDSPMWPFQTHDLTTDWTYVRFHYGRRGRRGNYSERELEEWKRRLAAWRSRVEIFAYFNNDREGIAPRNARWLAERLS